MKYGILYGIGVGPGDPELITVKGANIISKCEYVFVPKARFHSQSLALEIARSYIPDKANIRELVFPMSSDRQELAVRWTDAANQIVDVLKQGKDACFLTLGDPLLYSTYIHLVRSLTATKADIEIITIPGIMALNAAASLANFPLGEGKESVIIVPATDELDSVREALLTGGTVILMKIGKRLSGVLNILEKTGRIDNAIFVSRAGQKKQYIETDLRNFRKSDNKTGYMSVILVNARKENAR